MPVPLFLSCAALSSSSTTIPRSARSSLRSDVLVEALVRSGPAALEGPLGESAPSTR
jgi:hypothetical protein